MNGYPSTPRAGNRPRPWCCFRSGARSYAVDLKSVVEVIETDRLVRLPQSPRVVVGLCAFRRDVIPVVRLTSGEDDKNDGQARVDILILKTEQGFWGLRIDRSGTVVTEDTLQEDASLGAHEPALAPVLLGTLQRGDVACGVIDPESTWQRLRAAIEGDLRTPAGAAPVEAFGTGEGGAG